MLHGKEYDTFSKSDIDRDINLANVVKHYQYRLTKESATQKTEEHEAMQTDSIER